MYCICVLTWDVSGRLALCLFAFFTLIVAVINLRKYSCLDWRDIGMKPPCVYE